MKMLEGGELKEFLVKCWMTHEGKDARGPSASTSKIFSLSPEGRMLGGYHAPVPSPLRGEG